MPTATLRVQECPHCYAEVLFRQDGLCPACRRSRSDLEGADPDVTVVTIHDHNRVPSCCFLCGAETALQRKLAWSYVADPDASWLVRLVSLIPGSTRRVRHQVRLGVCDACWPRARQIQPLSTVAGWSCRLKVHPLFRQRFEALNEREAPEWGSDARVAGAPPAPRKAGAFPNSLRRPRPKVSE